jgi:hypothetical protein
MSVADTVLCVTPTYTSWWMTQIPGAPLASPSGL